MRARDFWLVKTDSYGNTQWNKTYGGLGRDEAYSIQQTSDGGYILGGSTRSFGKGLSDFWLVKTDSTGELMWNKTYGAPFFDVAYAVQQTSDGGCIVAGSTNSLGSGSEDFWVIKTDPDGGMQWNKTYGGLYDEVAYSVQQTSDEGYIIAGTTYSFGTSWDPDFWLIRLGERRLVTDIDGDGTVNIKDLFMVSKAFGSKLGEPRWNPDADTDGNKIINIIDMYQVARDFGKTA